MSTDLKRNAVFVLGLAALFYWSFMFTKHDPALRDVIPFSEDPYDAVGSFAVIVAIMIALLSLVRAFWPYREAPSKAQRVNLIRSQEAIVLAVFITLATDAVAMARHPLMWIGVSSRGRLIAVLGVLMTFTCAVQLLLRATQNEFGGFGKTRWAIPAIFTILAISFLAWYPEQLIQRTATHLITVIAGAILLFAAIRLLLYALMPYATVGGCTEKVAARSRFLIAGRGWTLSLFVGALIGAVAFLGEIGEGSGALSWGRMAFVASVYILLGMAGIVIAYAFLGKPLGLGQ